MLLPHVLPSSWTTAQKLMFLGGHLEYVHAVATSPLELVHLCVALVVTRRNHPAIAMFRPVCRIMEQEALRIVHRPVTCPRCRQNSHHISIPIEKMI